MKQTAVQWLIEQFWNNEGMLTSKKLEQAKEMEKDQIIIAYDNGWETGSYYPEKYYNETYGGNK